MAGRQRARSLRRHRRGIGGDDGADGSLRDGSRAGAVLPEHGTRRQSGGDGRLRGAEAGHPARAGRGRSQARVRLGRGAERVRPVRCRDHRHAPGRRLRDRRGQGRGARRRHRRQAHRLRAHRRRLPRPGRHRAVPRRSRRRRRDAARLPHRRRAARRGGRLRGRDGRRGCGARRSARRPAGHRGGVGTGDRRAVRGGGRGDGRHRAQHRRVPEDPRAVRPAHRQLSRSCSTSSPTC